MWLSLFIRCFAATTNDNSARYRNKNDWEVAGAMTDVDEESVVRQSSSRFLQGLVFRNPLETCVKLNHATSDAIKSKKV